MFDSTPSMCYLEEVTKTTSGRYEIRAGGSRPCKGKHESELLFWRPVQAHSGAGGGGPCGRPHPAFSSGACGRGRFRPLPWVLVSLLPLPLPQPRSPPGGFTWDIGPQPQNAKALLFNGRVSGSFCGYGAEYVIDGDPWGVVLLSQR